MDNAQIANIISSLVQLLGEGSFNVNSRGASNITNLVVAAEAAIGQLQTAEPVESETDIIEEIENDG